MFLLLRNKLKILHLCFFVIGIFSVTVYGITEELRVNEYHRRANQWPPNTYKNDPVNVQ